MMKNKASKVTVKQQTELLSKRIWGIYVDGKLVEGGFWTKAYAEYCAEQWRQKLAQDRVPVCTPQSH